jgi:hypothetical protein
MQETDPLKDTYAGAGDLALVLGLSLGERSTRRMAKSPTTTVSLDDIRAALRTAAEKFLRAIRKEHPGETLYGFLFEISCEGFSAHGAVATEEGLRRYAKEYAAKHGGDAAQLRAEFRWGSTEDAWYQQPDSAFAAVNRLLARAERDKLYELYAGVLEALCIDVLKELDAAGTFGTGVDRERVVLGVCYIGGDNSEKEFLGWAKQVNPPKVFKRLKAEYMQ